ncbi:hypothetical protein [Pseudomonas anguilliseptica]|uniref:hypothetical protein n=1 Tax=Pseudomonas anguilliseptica TaxID=53406 RepID=UPI001F2D33F0|nr:hypothetical protein [Pseudomonas anguilliseptica]MCE5364448.1 hypothetical protein [Pseudomonas anguilliseptica]
MEQVLSKKLLAQMKGNANSMVRNAALLDKLFRGDKQNKPKKEGLFSAVTEMLGVREDSIKTIVKAVLVVLSLASAHYSGFMTQVPFEMLSIVAVDFLSAFISIFVFYFLMSYTIARVFAFALSQFYFSFFHAIAAFVLRLRRQWPLRFNRTGSKIYKESTVYEKVLYWIVFVVGVYFIFNFSYLKVKYSEVDQVVWFLGGSIVLALILKAGFLARSPKAVITRLFDRKRIAYRRQILRAFIYFLTGLSLAFSYYLGIVRFDKIMDEEAVYISSEKFTGMANVLIKSGDSFLLVDKSAGLESFFYVNGKFSVRLKVEEGQKNKQSADG